MASSIFKLIIIILYFTIFFSFSTSTSAFNSSSPTTTTNTNLSCIQTFCQSTPYPEAGFDSLKLSISINISPNILNYLIQTLNTALSEAEKLTNQFSFNGGKPNIVEKQRGTMQDCKELHEITLSSLKKSVSKIQSGDSKKLADARSYLSAALTNKNTCLEGLDSASGSFKLVLVNSLGNIYKHVSNSLSMIPKSSGHHGKKGNKNRRLLGFPRWLKPKARRFLQDGDDEYDPSDVIIVAADGTGNFSTITDAISFARNNSYDRVIIYIKEGVYEENVEIPSYKTKSFEELLDNFELPVTAIISWVTKANYLLFTSVYELKGHVIDTLKARFDIPIYIIGPAIPYFELHENSSKSIVQNVLNYLQWLDVHPPCSVLYVSLGSYLSVSNDQMDEIAVGIQDSGVPYLWVARGKNYRLREKGGGTGLVVSWCDQPKVLCH